MVLQWIRYPCGCKIGLKITETTCNAAVRFVCYMGQQIMLCEEHETSLRIHTRRKTEIEKQRSKKYTDKVKISLKIPSDSQDRWMYGGVPREFEL
jgi:hypothetical protein